MFGGITPVSCAQFTMHSDLGRVVQAIIREFERRPPHLVGETSGRLSATNQKGKNFNLFIISVSVCYFFL
jgi:hypothetical protein